VSLTLLVVLLVALSVWNVAGAAAAVDAGRRWGWWWGIGLWLLWPVAIFPWAIRRHREKAADREAGIGRPVGV
jgi:hypothetical protein